MPFLHNMHLRQTCISFALFFAFAFAYPFSFRAYGNLTDEDVIFPIEGTDTVVKIHQGPAIKDPSSLLLFLYDQRNACKAKIELRREDYALARDHKDPYIIHRTLSPEEKPEFIRMCAQSPIRYPRTLTWRALGDAFSGIHDVIAGGSPPRVPIHTNIYSRSTERSLGTIIMTWTLVGKRQDLHVSNIGWTDTSGICGGDLLQYDAD